MIATNALICTAEEGYISRLRIFAIGKIRTSAAKLRFSLDNSILYALQVRDFGVSGHKRFHGNNNKLIVVL